MSIQIGINLWCPSTDGWFGLWCTPWSDCQTELWRLSLFLFPDEEVLVLKKDPDIWSGLKMGPSASVWKSTGWDKWHLPPSTRLGTISSFCFLSPPPSQPSPGWSVLLYSPGHSWNIPHFPWAVQFGNAQYSWIQQTMCVSFSVRCLFWWVAWKALRSLCVFQPSGIALDVDILF